SKPHAHRYQIRHMERLGGNSLFTATSPGPFDGVPGHTRTGRGAATDTLTAQEFLALGVSTENRLRIEFLDQSRAGSSIIEVAKPFSPSELVLQLRPPSAGPIHMIKTDTRLNLPRRNR